MTLAAMVWLGACRAPQVQVSHPAIPVADSIRLAADVVLPIARPAAGVPTVLIQTRYWRSFRMRGGGGPTIPQGPREPIVARLVAAGMAVVIADVRGTGASDGVWRWPWSAEEVQDMGPLIDWIVAQPWSNGIVGATGVSYEGTTALLAATADRPALRAVLARQIEWQLADETLAPGGVRNVLFPDVWGRTVDDLDHGRYPAMFPWYARWFVSGVMRRDDDASGAGQRGRESSRPASQVAQRAAQVRRGSDRFGADGPAADSLGPAGHAAALSRTRAVVGIWGSWWDGATADAVFRAQAAMPIVEARIGPWTHEGTENASPHRRRSSDRATVDLDSVVAFFARHLRAEAASTAASTAALEERSRRVSWFVAGAEAWRSAATWPTTSDSSWEVVPTSVETPVQWTVSTPASTGTHTRWTTGLARTVDVADRARAAGVRSFLLMPLTAPLTVFGAGQFRCPLQPDQPAATVHVYLESVSASGEVRLLTEGMQRVERDTLARAAVITVRLRPVAFALPAGWRLRVSLASEDAPTFERVPAAGPVSWTVTPRGCALQLPVESRG